MEREISLKCEIIDYDRPATKELLLRLLKEANHSVIGFALNLLPSSTPEKLLEYALTKKRINKFICDKINGAACKNMPEGEEKAPLKRMEYDSSETGLSIGFILKEPGLELMIDSMLQNARPESATDFSIASLIYDVNKQISIEEKCKFLQMVFNWMNGNDFLTKIFDALRIQENEWSQLVGNTNLQVGKIVVSLRTKRESEDEE